MRRAAMFALLLPLGVLPLAHHAFAQRARDATVRTTSHRRTPPRTAPRPRARDAGTPLPEIPTTPIRCASDEECRAYGRPGARCFTPSIAAQYTQAFRDCASGGSWRAQHEPGTCVFDECRPEDAPGGDTCGEGLRCATPDMVPFPQRVCVPATCRNDIDCRRHPGGRCVSFLNGGRCIQGGWACSYPADPCVPRDPNRMCPVVQGMLNYCAPRNGRFTCVQEPAVIERGPEEPSAN